jgi:hypothetical protein
MQAVPVLWGDVTRYSERHDVSPIGMKAAWI